jgi:hypothetical protein
MKINKKGRVNFIFSNHTDSVVFNGRIKFKKNGSIEIENNIRQSLYLGDLEQLISAELREDMRKVFTRTFSCAIENDQLLLYYNTPSDLRHKKVMVLSRRDGEGLNKRRN